jgi:hypothetical protein
MKNATVAKSVDEVGQVLQAKKMPMPKSRAKPGLEHKQMNRKQMTHNNVPNRSMNMKGDTPASLMLRSLAV